MSESYSPEVEAENRANIENQPIQQSNEGVFKVPSVPEDPVDIEREQEAKLKAKYGMMKKPGGGSALLQKRLQKGNKYFDSGDYNMAKAKMNNPKRPLAPKEKLLLQESIGGAIPTPTEVDNIRRPSQVASKLLIGADKDEEEEQ